MIVPGVLTGNRGSLLYSQHDIRKSVTAWNGIPIVVDHPKVDDRYVSARKPEILDRYGVGFVFNVSSVNGNLDGEAWIDIEKLRAVNPALANRTERGDKIEVSTGLGTENQPERGSYRGKEYTHRATNFAPDHLALLPTAKGACSLDDGCGLAVNEMKALVKAYEKSGTTLSFSEWSLEMEPCKCHGECQKCKSSFQKTVNNEFIMTDWSFQPTVNAEGVWRTTEDGSRIFISGSGEVRAGGPKGKVLKKGTGKGASGDKATGKSFTHGVHLREDGKGPSKAAQNEIAKLAEKHGGKFGSPTDKGSEFIFQTEQDAANFQKSVKASKFSKEAWPDDVSELDKPVTEKSKSQSALSSQESEFSKGLPKGYSIKEDSSGYHSIIKDGKTVGVLTGATDGGFFVEGVSDSTLHDHIRDIGGKSSGGSAQGSFKVKKTDFQSTKPESPEAATSGGTKALRDAEKEAGLKPGQSITKETPGKADIDDALKIKILKDYKSDSTKGDVGSFYEYKRAYLEKASTADKSTPTKETQIKSGDKQAKMQQLVSASIKAQFQATDSKTAKVDSTPKKPISVGKTVKFKSTNGTVSAKIEDYKKGSGGPDLVTVSYKLPGGKIKKATMPVSSFKSKME